MNKAANALAQSRKDGTEHARQGACKADLHSPPADKVKQLRGALRHVGAAELPNELRKAPAVQLMQRLQTPTAAGDKSLSDECLGAACPARHSNEGTRQATRPQPSCRLLSTAETNGIKQQMQLHVCVPLLPAS